MGQVQLSGISLTLTCTEALGNEEAGAAAVFLQAEKGTHNPALGADGQIPKFQVAGIVASHADIFEIGRDYRVTIEALEPQADEQGMRDRVDQVPGQMPPV